MENEDTIDPWDHQSQFNLTPEELAKNIGDSLNKQVKKAKKISKKDEEKLAKAISEKPVVVPLTMAQRYKKAQEIVFKQQSAFRQKEIDNQLKSGKLSDKDWDDEFAKAIVALAESNVELN
jgi:hypothetical protein